MTVTLLIAARKMFEHYSVVATFKTKYLGKNGPCFLPFGLSMFVNTDVV